MAHPASKALWLAAGSVALLAGSVPGASAQTWVGSSGSWSDPAKWSAAPPTPSPATAVWFPMLGAGSLAYTSVVDHPGPFTLNDVTVQGLAGGSLAIAANGLSGGLRFDGAAPSLVALSGGTTHINASVATATGGGTLAVALASGATIAFNAPLSSTGGLTVLGSAGSGVALASRNRLTGTVSVNNAALVLGSVDSLGTAALTVDAGRLSLGSSTFATAPGRSPYLRNAITTTAGGLILGDARSFTITAPVTGGGGITVLPSTLSIGTWTLAGNNLFSGAVSVFSAPGTTPGILNTLAFTGNAAIGNAAAFTVNGTGAAVGFLGGPAGYTVSQPLTVNAGGNLAVFNDGGRARVTYAGAIGGSGGLTRIGDGVLTLSAASNGFTGGLTLADGLTIASTDAQLGGVGGGVSLAGGSLLLDPAFGTTTRAFTLGAADAGTLITDGDVLLSGAITNGTGGPGGFAKAGTGNLVLTNTGNSVGSVVINGGTIAVTGAAGRLLATGSMAINDAGALVLDNTAAAVARMNGTAPVLMRGGTLRLVGNATVNSSAVTTGALALNAVGENTQGVTLLRAEPGASANALIRFGSLGRTANNGAFVVFSGAGLGLSTITSAVAGQSNIAFTTAPTLVNGILPYAVADRGAGPELASYNATNGVVPATYTSSTLNNGTVATHNVSVGSEAILAGGGTINAAKFTGGTIDLTAGTLTVTSGALLFAGPTTVTGGTLTIGTGTTNTDTAPTAAMYVAADTSIASRIVTFNPMNGLQGGITKAGPAALTLLNSTNNYVGPTRVLEGTLKLGTSNAIPNNSGVILGPGAVFDLNGFNDSIGTLAQAPIPPDAGSFQNGTVLLGNSTLIVGGENASGSFALDVIGAGTLVKSGAGSLTVSGTQQMTGTVTVANGTLALGTHLALGTGFSNVARINVGTAGTNGEVALRFEEGLAGYDRPISVQAVAGRTATLAFDDAVGATVASPITIANAQGLIVDAAGGPTLSGVISGTGPLTTTTTGVGEVDSRRYSVRISGDNTYTGTTTLAADATVFGNSNAFGPAGGGTILLGSSAGDDMPELSADVAGITLARPISVQGSISAVPNRAIIGTRVTGSGAVVYSGTISIAGSRSRLVLYSAGGPAVFSGAIVGTLSNSTLQVGHAFNDQDITTRGTVVLSGANTFLGGTTLAAGALALGVDSVFINGSGILSSPVGRGALMIGLGTLASGHVPRLAASGGPRTLHNNVVLTRDVLIGGGTTLSLLGTLDTGTAPRQVIVEPVTTLRLGGAIGGSASSALVKAGPGTLVLDGTVPGVPYSGSVVVAEGTLGFNRSQFLGPLLHVGPGATAAIDSTGPARVVTSAAVSVDAANGGRYDLGDNGGIVNYGFGSSPLSAVTALIATGRNGGDWTGPGITSSVAAATPGTGVGVIEAADLGLSGFLGQGFVGNAVLMRYTLLGDATLDGTVDIGDFSELATNFNLPGRWFTGDFNYSGTVDIGDFAAMAANFNAVLPAPAALPRAGAVVPEPATALAGAIALCWTTGRRRRRSNLPGAM